MTASDTNASRPQARIAPGPLGRGVYLSDLVRWLMRKHEATRTQVVKDHLCPVLVEHSPALYGVWDSGDTKALSDMEWFQSGSGYREVQQTGRPHVLSRGIGYPVNPRPMTPSLGLGLEGAVAWLRAYWGNAINSDAVTLDNWKHAVAARLAVSEADARRCWGWGADTEAEGAAETASVFPLADWAALVAYRKANTKNGRAPAWDRGNQIDIGKAELKQRQNAGATKSDALNAMGVDLGLKATAGRTVLERALFGERKRGKAAKGQPAPALPSIAVRSGKRAV